MKISGIYIIKNTLDGKVYVGSSTHVNRRWACHRHNLRNNKHSSKHLQAAWNKYGEAAFKFLLLERVFTTTNLLWREQFFLKYYKSYDSKFGYNTRHIAEANYGLVPSSETRQKISLGNKGKVVTEETANKIRIANTGRKYGYRSQEFKDNLSQQFTGRELSEETRLKISQANTGRIPSAKTRALWSEQRKGKQLGEDNPFYGRKHSPETIEKCRQAAIEQNRKRRESI